MLDLAGSEALAAWSRLGLETKVCLIVIALAASAMHVRFSAKAARQGPALLTTAGIFATFLGIASGLSGFNPQDLEASVVTLLAGLKSAFWASALGVGAGLSLKCRSYVFSVPEGTAGAASDQNALARSTLAVLHKLSASLEGADLRPLATQWQLTADAILARLDPLPLFADQIGGRCHDLTSAADRLVQWQSDYRHHMEAGAAQLEALLIALHQVTRDYTQVVAASSHFAQTAGDLGLLLSALVDERTRLTTLTEALATAVTKATGGLPQFEEQIEALTGSFSAAVTQSAADLAATASTMREQLEAAQTQMSRSLEEALVQTSQNLIASAAAAFDKMSASSLDFDHHATEIATRTKEQVLLLDRALSEELEKSLTSLGRQLALLSAKFVDDYGPLTDRLRDIVQLAATLEAV